MTTAHQGHLQKIIIINIKGATVPGNESSTERKFHKTFVPGRERPGSERARERKFQGANWPGSYSLRGANWPGSEKARYIRFYGIKTCILYYAFSKLSSLL